MISRLTGTPTRWPNEALAYTVCLPRPVHGARRPRLLQPGLRALSALLPGRRTIAARRPRAMRSLIRAGRGDGSVSLDGGLVHLDTSPAPWPLEDTTFPGRQTAGGAGSAYRDHRTGALLPARDALERPLPDGLSERGASPRQSGMRSAA